MDLCAAGPPSTSSRRRNPAPAIPAFETILETSLRAPRRTGQSQDLWHDLRPTPFRFPSSSYDFAARRQRMASVSPVLTNGKRQSTLETATTTAAEAAARGAPAAAKAGASGAAW